MNKEKKLRADSILSALDEIIEGPIKGNLERLNGEIINETYSCENLDRVRVSMALTDIDEKLSSYVIGLAKSKLGITINEETVVEIFKGREEKIIPARYLKSSYKREIFALDAISYYFIGCEISTNRVSDAESIFYEIKMAAMEEGFDVDGVFFMNREL